MDNKLKKIFWLFTLIPAIIFEIMRLLSLLFYHSSNLIFKHIIDINEGSYLKEWWELYPKK